MASNKREIPGGEARYSGPDSPVARVEGAEVSAVDAEELERRARHQEEGEERRDVTDADVGEDRILTRGLTGGGAGGEARQAPSGSDTSRTRK
jgi:hypothetical protein